MAKMNRQVQQHTMKGRFAGAALAAAFMVTSVVPGVVLAVSPSEKAQWQESVLSQRMASEKTPGEQSLVPMATNEEQTYLRVEVLSDTGIYTGQPIYPELKFTTLDGEEVEMVPDINPDLDADVLHGDYALFTEGDVVNASTNPENINFSYDWYMFVNDGEGMFHDVSYVFVDENGDPMEAWGMIEGKFTITPKPVDFTVTNLSFGTDGETPCQAVVTADGLTLDKDFTVRYYPQTGTDVSGNPIFDQLPVPIPTAFGTYLVEIAFINGRNFTMNSINGKNDPVYLVIGQKTCAVTYKYNNDIDGFSGAQEDVVYQIPQSAQIGSNIPATPNTPPSLKWLGWYTDLGGTEVEITSNYTVQVDMEIYAKWGPSDNANLTDMIVMRNGSAVILTEDDYETPKPFDPDGQEYFLRVSKDVDEITVEVSAFEPTSRIVVRNGSTQIQPTGTGAGTWIVPLEPASSSSQDNRVQISVTAPNGTSVKTYTIRVLRLREPTFTLGYGNSPCGRIMSEVVDKDGAKTIFEQTRTYAGMRYNTAAWADYKDYDGDKDETALFVGQQGSYKDAALSLVNSLGKSVNLDEITRTIEFKIYSGGIPSAASMTSGTPVQVTDRATAPITMPGRPGAVVVPGVYEMVYSYNDPLQGQVTAIRKCIVTGTVGDVDMNLVLSSVSDSRTIEQNILALNTAPSLYRFRVADVLIDENDVINIADSAMLERVSSANLPEFYPAVK